MPKTLASPAVRSPSREARPRTPSLAEQYRAVRGSTEALVEPLAAEDQVPQSMLDASPTKWHLAHTTWFFETFVLTPNVRSYRPFRPEFAYLFNSYYNAVGPQYARPRRGLLTRPTVGEVARYREHVDRHMLAYLEEAERGSRPIPAEVMLLGLNHEQQHQELILTDVKHLFSQNPLHPVYRERRPIGTAAPIDLGWTEFEAGLRELGHNGPGFAFDNEGPRHRAYLGGYRLACRLVTSGEYRAFMEDGGYRRPELWLSDGWAAVCEEGWRAPLYWMDRDGEWWHHTLAGFRKVDDAEPVSHVSYYEADAYARWAGARLPTEAEWESAAAVVPIAGNFVDDRHYHPVPAEPAEDGPAQLFGDVWEWTQSAYLAYPGYRAVEGALGEYNGKFMCNQFVLRGGSCATPRSHIRATYRNFFPPSARWQFTGIRLADDR